MKDEQQTWFSFILHPSSFILSISLPRCSMQTRWLLMMLLLTVAACGKQGSTPVVAPGEPEPAPVGPALFEDITTSSGVHFTYRNGEDTAEHRSILESLGGGVALIDFDGDGLLDLFLPGGGSFAGKDKKTIIGQPCKLFRNLG